jgi:hypothetical protein
MESLNREWRDIIETDLIDPLRTIVRGFESKDFNINLIHAKFKTIKESFDSFLFEVKEELEYLDEQPWRDSDEGEFEDWAEARYGTMNEWYEEKSYLLNDFIQRLEAIREEMNMDLKIEHIPKLKEIIFELEYLDIPNRYE